MTMETVFRQMLALRLGDGDEHHPLESDTTGLNVKGNLYLYNTYKVTHDTYIHREKSLHIHPGDHNL